MSWIEINLFRLAARLTGNVWFIDVVLDVELEVVLFAELLDVELEEIKELLEVVEFVVMLLEVELVVVVVF